MICGYNIIMFTGVICKVCGAVFSKMITNTHLKSHNMSISDYRALYGSKSHISPYYSLERSIQSLDDNPMKGRKHSIDTKEKISSKKKDTTPWNKGITFHGHQLDEIRTSVQKREERYNSGELIRSITIPSCETRKKISTSMKGKIVSFDTKKKLSVIGKRRGSPMTGKTHNEETKKLIGLKSREVNSSKRDNSIKEHIDRINKDNFTVVEIKDKKYYLLKCNDCGLEVSRRSSFFTNSKWKNKTNLNYCNYCERNPELLNTSIPEQ